MHLISRPLTVCAAAGLAASAALTTVAAQPAQAAPAHRSVAHWHVPRRVSPHVMGRHRRHAGGSQQSLNWAGYVRTGRGVTSATASWKVPALSAAHDGYSSTWVGVDGATAGDGYLIQTGTEADVENGRRSYRAWWEVITPTDVAPETLFGTLAISPGDSISASVARTSSRRWTMRISDTTTHRSASHTASFAGPGSSVEWIQEDTDVDGYISSAPDWGSVAFGRLTVNGANPKLAANEAVDIVDSHGTRETSTGRPTSAGAGFTVRWLAPGTRTKAG